MPVLYGFELGMRRAIETKSAWFLVVHLHYEFVVVSFSFLTEIDFSVKAKWFLILVFELVYILYPLGTSKVSQYLNRSSN